MKKAVYKWLRLLVDKSMGLFVTSFITIILYAGLLYLISFLWMIYIETPMGRKFLSLNIADLAAIEILQTESLLALSLEIILTVLLVCLVLGALGQVLLLIRYFHEGRGFPQRLLFWGVPCIAFTAVNISENYEIGWAASVLLGLVPALLLFNRCLKFASALLPEISTVFEGVAALARNKFISTADKHQNDLGEFLRGLVKKFMRL